MQIKKIFAILFTAVAIVFANTDSTALAKDYYVYSNQNIAYYVDSDTIVQKKYDNYYSARVKHVFLNTGKVQNFKYHNFQHNGGDEPGYDGWMYQISDSRSWDYYQPRRYFKDNPAELYIFKFIQNWSN